MTRAFLALLILLPGIAFAQPQPPIPASVRELAEKLAGEIALSAMKTDRIAALEKQIETLREAMQQREKPKE